LKEHWEREARAWTAWAREPGHDSYWRVAPFFFALVPPPGRRTLDLGCGEGRVARDLAAHGHTVIGIDSSPSLVDFARQADPEGEYLVGDAAALPFADASFDVVVAFNSLMDVEDMAGAVREAARVLEPGGRFCISLVHPLAYVGRFESREPDAPFVFEAPYFERRETHETFERAGLRMTFHSFVRPLSDYTEALADGGLLLDALHEPPLPGDDERWRRVPNFIHLRALKRR
jgi:ubiquinone/menaquinone biosynthesis C-methylase UbiE